MSREDGTILVKPMDGHLGLMYQVESWTNPSTPHLVDLSQYSGNGACSCADFQCRREPAIKKGAVLFSREATCKHCRAVHRYWLKAALGAYVAHHKQGTS